MSFWNPKIKWHPREIKGSFDITSDKQVPKSIEDSPRAGEPMVDKTAQPGVQSTIAANVNPRVNFSPEEQQFIDEFIELLEQRQKELDDLHNELERHMEDCVLTYDEKQNVLLAQAHHCPYCGNPNGGNKITWDDIKKKEAGKKAMMANVIGMPAATQAVMNGNTKDLLGTLQQQIQDMINDVLDMVWRQIVIWVLEVIYSFVQPLEYVTMFGLDKIPKGIRYWINKISKKQNTGLSWQDMEKTLNSTSDEKRDQQAAEAYYKGRNLGDLGSLKDIYDTGSSLYKGYCSIHYVNFDEYKAPLIQETKYAPIAEQLAVVDVQRDLLDTIRQFAGIAIPDAYATPTGTIFKNVLPEEYLRAAMNGTGPVASRVLAGAKELLKDQFNKFVESAKKNILLWLTDEKVVCCLLRTLFNISNINVSADLKEGRKILLGIRAILKLALIDLNFNLSADLASLVNMIMELVVSSLRKILQTLITTFKSALSERIFNQDLIKRLKTGVMECIPALELVLDIERYLKKWLDDMEAYLLSFVENLKATAIKGYKINLSLNSKWKLKWYIDLIDAILKYMRLWEFCKEEASRRTTGTRSESLLPSLSKSFSIPQETIENIIQNINKQPTINSDEPVLGLGLRETSGQQHVPASPTTDIQAASLDTLRIFLTNTMGLSDDAADRVLTDKGDCGCDNAINIEDLMAIRNAIAKELNTP